MLPIVLLSLLLHSDQGKHHICPDDTEATTRRDPARGFRSKCCWLSVGNGSCTAFYATGEEAARGWMVDGVKDGVWLYSYRTGQPRKHEVWVDGRPSGRWIWLTKEGQTRREVRFSGGRSVWDSEGPMWSETSSRSATSEGRLVPPAHDGSDGNPFAGPEWQFYRLEHDLCAVLEPQGLPQWDRVRVVVAPTGDVVGVQLSPRDKEFHCRRSALVHLRAPEPTGRWHVFLFSRGSQLLVPRSR